MESGEVSFVKDRFGLNNGAISIENQNFLVVDGTEEAEYLNTDDEFAISLWFKLDSSSLQRKVVLIFKSHNDENGEYNWEISHNPSGGIEFTYANSGICCVQRVYDTDWHHVAITYQKIQIWSE